jgi:uncharacterized protein (DUF952 family)
MVGRPMTIMVYKVLTAADWRAACAVGQFTGSADDRRDGFIHLSTAAQLPRTLAKFFAGQTELVLLAVRATDVGHALRWEGTGDALYPHLYGVLPAGSVVQAWSLPLDADGRHILPQDLI